MSKCQICSKNDITLKEIFSGKRRCSECEQNGRKFPSFEERLNTIRQNRRENPIVADRFSALKGFLFLAFAFFGVYQCGKCNATKTERVELPNGMVQTKVVQNDKSESLKVEKETTPSKIPNVVSYEIYSRFLQAGFNDLGKSISTDGCFWTFDRQDDEGTYYLRIYGNNPNEVQEIKASFMGESNKVAKFYLTEVARTAYKGSDFTKASHFISQNINSRTETQIGGIKLEILGSSSMKTMTIVVNGID